MEEDKEIKLNVVDEDQPQEPTPEYQEPKPENQPEKPPKKEEEIKVKVGFLRKIQFWQGLSVLFIILFVVSLFFISGSGGEITKTEAKSRIQGYVDAVLPPTALVILGDVTEENNLYKVPVNIQGEELDTFVTKDGSLFFPTAVDLNNIPTNPLLAGTPPPVTPPVPPIDDTPILEDDIPTQDDDTTETNEETTEEDTS